MKRVLVRQEAVSMTLAIDGQSLVKKSVVLHPLMDQYVRKTWALLIDGGHDATYSTALNFMLLAAIEESIKDGGLSEETRNDLWEFVNDQKTIQKLNLQEHLGELRRGLMQEEMES
jgi:hypothetical protein